MILVVVYGPKHVWNWLHEKKGLSCARPRKSGMHIKTSHKFFCHNSNRYTNLASNFLSEETAWRNIIVFARAKNVATRLTSLLFVKIPLKLFGPANFDLVRWNNALHQTECPVKYFCLREVCNIQKTRTQNSQWKQRYRWKRYRSMTRRNVRHFPPASGRMTPINVYLWHHREHGNSNKSWRQRRFGPSQETGVKKIINGNVSSEFISLWFASVHGAASSIQKFVSPLVLRLQKVQER